MLTNEENSPGAPTLIPISTINLHVLTGTGNYNPLIMRTSLDLTIQSSSPLMVSIASPVPVVTPAHILSTMFTLHPGEILITLPTLINLQPSNMMLTIVPLDIPDITPLPITTVSPIVRSNMLSSYNPNINPGQVSSAPRIAQLTRLNLSGMFN